MTLSTVSVLPLPTVNEQLPARGALITTGLAMEQ
jgi:hypothetical protein